MMRTVNQRIVEDINSCVKMRNTPKGFMIDNHFSWYDQQSHKKLTAYAKVEVVKTGDTITVDRCLCFDGRVFTTETITAGNWFDVFEVVGEQFDFRLDAVVNSTQNWEGNNEEDSEDSFDSYMQVAEYVFHDRNIPRQASLLFTSVNNGLIKIIIKKIYVTHKLNNLLKLHVSSSGVDVRVYGPIIVDGKEWFLGRWRKTTGNNTSDTVLWLAHKHILSDLLCFSSRYAGNNYSDVDYTLFSIALSINRELHDGESVEVRVRRKRG